MYLLDTNVCIDFALARSEILRQRVNAAYPRGLAISAITLAELRVGAGPADPADERRLDTLARLLTVVPFDAGAADVYGRIARQIGFKRRSFDRLIAAQAVAGGLILVTNDQGDFADVPGLQVENWTV